MNKKDNEQKVDTSIKSFLLPKISAEGIVIVAVFFAIAFFLLLLSDVIGMFAMKVSAYLQPFTHRLTAKIKKGR